MPAFRATHELRRSLVSAAGLDLPYENQVVPTLGALHFDGGHCLYLLVLFAYYGDGGFRLAVNHSPRSERLRVPRCRLLVATL